MTEKEKSIHKQRKNVFLSGVLVLSLASVAVKVIGLIYKIPMLRLLGSEGMGYFNSAYELYSLLCVIATSGLPVAMSVMISALPCGDEEGADRIFKVALKLFLGIGVVGTLLLLGFARPFATFLGSESGIYCILAIAPTVLLICISSAYRGYFQGFGQMMPTAISQLLESLGKLVFGLALAFFALFLAVNTTVNSAVLICIAEFMFKLLFYRSDAGGICTAYLINYTIFFCINTLYTVLGIFKQL